MSIKNCLLFLCTYLYSISGIFSQSVDLNRKINCHFVNQKATIVLKEVERQADIIFSYSGLNDSQEITLVAKDRKLSDVINLLAVELHVKAILKDRYIILKNLPKEKQLEVYGIITEKTSNLPLANVSIYVKNLKLIANTDDAGKYKFTIPQNNRAIAMSIAKENYMDTLVVFIASKNQNISASIGMPPKQKIHELAAIHPTIKEVKFNDSITSLPFSLWQKLETKNANLLNIKDTILNSLSVSLIPPISSNKLLAFNTRNSIALNIIGGYSKGIDILELGGVYNLDYGSVQYVQIAGAVNLVNGNTLGVQLGGVANLDRGDMNGVQVGGAINYANNVSGVQLAGAYNNNFGTSTGVQVSGVYQSTYNLEGLQIAGVYNTAKKVNGLQISGLINKADTLTGLQIGLFNFSNQSKSGISIGLINFVKNGYFKPEISYDDLGFAGFALRTGRNIFHTYLKLAYRHSSKDSSLVQGRFGLASSIPLSAKINLELDLSSGSFHRASDITQFDSNIHNQFLLGFSYQPTRKFGIRTGVTLNHWYFDNSTAIAGYTKPLIDQNIYETNSGTKQHVLWLGYQVSLLF